MMVFSCDINISLLFLFLQAAACCVFNIGFTLLICNISFNINLKLLSAISIISITILRALLQHSYLVKHTYMYILIVHIHANQPLNLFYLLIFIISVTMKLSNFNNFRIEQNSVELIRFCHGEPYPTFYEFFDYFCAFL